MTVVVKSDCVGAFLVPMIPIGSPGRFLRQGLTHMLWKPVPGFLDYEVSEYGDARRGQRPLIPERTQGNGRKRFSLSKGGRIFRLKAHQMVALAFIGPPPFDGAEVCHKDGFHHNNHYSNLRWDTHAANVADAVNHELARRERSGKATNKHRISAATSDFLASAN